MRTVSQKMGIKEGSRSILINAPAETVADINLPGIDNQTNLSGEFDYIHLFVINRKTQEELFPKLKSHLKLDGMLWVSWPKNKQLNTDLTLPVVIKVGYSFGLVESTCLSINQTWSALKFTHPREGKIYNNSHAILRGRTTNR